MVRAFAILVLAATLITGCAGRARKPAMIIGGALTLGGAALVAQANSHDCSRGTLGDGLTCVNDTIVGTSVGGLGIALGLGLLAGALLGGGGERSAQQASNPTPPPTPIAEAPPSDPSNPPPAMEPEPASW